MSRLQATLSCLKVQGSNTNSVFKLRHPVWSVQIIIIIITCSFFNWLKHYTVCNSRHCYLALTYQLTCNIDNHSVVNHRSPKILSPTCCQRFKDLTQLCFICVSVYYNFFYFNNRPFLWLVDVLINFNVILERFNHY